MNDLLNGIIRALPRLSPAELQMLADVVRRQRETAETNGAAELLLRDTSSPPPPLDENLLAKEG